MNKLNKRGQITIFVILGLMLVALVFMFLNLKKDKPNEIGGKSEKDIRGFFESCLETKVKQTVGILMERGGYFDNPLNISFKFRNTTEIENISYLCYTSREFISCTNQEPMLMNHLRDEIHREISNQVRICFDEIATSLEKQGETVEAKYSGFSVEIAPRKINIYVDGEITSTKSEQTTTQKDIKAVFPSRLHEVTRVVQEIVNQEATYCNFELLGFMLFYPEFEINKYMTRNSTAIYTVKHNKGVEKFNFAVRSCSFPPGF